VVATGSTAVFRKTAGTYDGYAANLPR